LGHGRGCKKKIGKRKKPVKKSATEYSDLPYLGNDPYFVKKAEDAKAMLVKAGIILKD
jgi:hypothetical protein